MLVAIEHRDDLCVLRLKGRFHTGSDADYLLTMCDEVTAHGTTKVMADFGEVPYLDSTGVGFLVRLHTRLTNAGGKLALHSLVPRVREVLEITRLLSTLQVYPDEPSALSALGVRGTAEPRAAPGAPGHS